MYHQCIRFKGIMCRKVSFLPYFFLIRWYAKDILLLRCYFWDKKKKKTKEGKVLFNWYVFYLFNGSVILQGLISAKFWGRKYYFIKVDRKPRKHKLNFLLTKKDLINLRLKFNSSLKITVLIKISWTSHWPGLKG